MAGNQYFLLFRCTQEREKLPIRSISNIFISKTRPVVTISFNQPRKVLVVEALNHSDEYQIRALGATLNALKRGETKATNEKIGLLPPLDILEKQLKPQPASLSIQSNNQQAGSLDNKCLNRLVIDDCRKLSKKIWTLPHLTHLQVNNCGLKSIPEEVVQLKKTLTILDLSNNQIEFIESTIFLQLHGIRTLNLSRNKIRSLPFQLAFMRELITLDISWNSLTKLPFTMCTLSKLKELNISHNQLDHLSASLINPPTKAKKTKFLNLNMFDFSGNKMNSVKTKQESGQVAEDSSQNSSIFTTRSLCLSEMEESYRRLQQRYYAINGFYGFDEKTYRPYFGGSELIWRKEETPAKQNPKSGESIESMNIVVERKPFPSLKELSGSACLRSLKFFKLFHEWVPRTVHEYLQTYSNLCSKCARPSICYHQATSLKQVIWSDFSQTITSDSTSTKIPILDFFCYYCTNNQHLA